MAKEAERAAKELVKGADGTGSGWYKRTITAEHTGLASARKSAWNRQDGAVSERLCFMERPFGGSDLLDSVLHSCSTHHPCTALPNRFRGTSRRLIKGPLVTLLGETACPSRAGIRLAMWQGTMGINRGTARGVIAPTTLSFKDVWLNKGVV